MVLGTITQWGWMGYVGKFECFAKKLLFPGIQRFLFFLEHPIWVFLEIKGVEYELNTKISGLL